LLPYSTIGVGPTRWETLGQPNDVNAHPHLDAEPRVAVVHNGIIENFFQLREGLVEKGYEFVSQTDSETVAHLVHAQLKDSRDLAEAVRAVCRQLEGAFTIVVVDAQDPDVDGGARRNSPLVVGREAGKTFLGSDVAAFIAYTREAMELD